MDYLVIFQGGEGPDVWDKETVLCYEKFIDAAQRADWLAKDMGGHVVEITACTETHDQRIRNMTNRFLCWPLPQDFAPDNGISFTKPTVWPTGTNLFNAEQATKMVEVLLGARSL